MKTCDEDTAVFMSQALLNHAKEIYRYAKTYRQPFDASVPPTQAADNLKKKYHSTVKRMIEGMNALMLMANYKGISRFCNQEQIEAYIEMA
ncbi:MAG: hypothetical protein LIP23_05695, partial [Planctomycetes bacterium]|nr:hypothetical protein [Planctomycetota bacterium]